LNKSIYHLTLPVMKKSLTQIPVYSNEGDRIGSVQRYFENKIQYLVDCVFDEWFIHVRMYDEKENLIVYGVEQLDFSIQTLFQSRWKIYKISEGEVQEYIFRDRTKIKTNPRLEFVGEGISLKFKKDIGDRILRVYDEEGELVSSIKTETILPPRKVTIQMLENKGINIHLLTCLYYIYSLKER
jgi:hypothetical protein